MNLRARCFLLLLLLPPFLPAADSTHLAPIVELATQIDDAAVRTELLRGMLDGLRGTRELPAPDADRLADLAILTETQDKRLAPMLPGLFANSALRLPAIREQVLGKAEVAKRAVSPVSLMPDALSRTELRDLVAYLRTSQPLETK
jgi:hypothetical protein